MSSRASSASSPNAGGGLDDDARLEAQAHVAAFAAVCSEGTSNVISPSTAAQGRRAEDLAVGQVRLAGAGLPGAAVDVDAQVGAGGRDAQLAHARQPLDQPRVALAQLRQAATGSGSSSSSAE